MADCRVYLVPGFFGFTQIGALSYFHRVADTLTAALRQRDVAAEVVECMTQPTGSIGRRADKLITHVIESEGLQADDIHFVGHSTGGLDIRLLVTPGVQLRPDDTEVEIGARTRSVITVATPHYGTPLANFFTTLPGRQFLEMLTLLATTGGGRYAIFAATRVLNAVARVDDWTGRDSTFLDWVVKNLLARVNTDPDDPIWAFLREVAADQGAIIQLTPESMHLFNAAVSPRPGVRYGSLVTAAPAPPLSYLTRDYLSLARVARAGAFAVLYAIAAREHSHYPYPPQTVEMLNAMCPELHITGRTNDGIVPTRSQAYGEILNVVIADHLDVVGQFRNAAANPYSDWLPSGSGFDEARFHRCWDGVAKFIADSRTPR